MIASSVKRPLSSCSSNSSVCSRMPKRKVLKPLGESSSNTNSVRVSKRPLAKQQTKQRKVLGQLASTSIENNTIAARLSKKSVTALPSYVTPPRPTLTKMITQFRELSTARANKTEKPAFEIYHDPKEYTASTKFYWAPGENKENELACKKC